MPVCFKPHAPLLAIVCLSTLCAITHADTKLDLTPSDPASLPFERVVATLEVGGHLLVAPENVATEDAESKAERTAERQLPLSVHATIEYDQWYVPARLAADWLDDAADATLAMRRYDKAEAVIKVDDGGQQVTLPSDRQLVVVRQQPAGRATFWCPAGPLERAQRDLIDIVGNPLALSALLPAGPIAETESWKQDVATITELLVLDEVAVCEVESVVEKSAGRHIQVRVAGAVHGTIDGAATEMELRAVYLFDLHTRRITKFNMAIKEKRSIGHATPGLDVVAKLQLSVTPQSRSDTLGEDALAELAADDAQISELLSYDGRRQGLKLQYDPQWFVTGEDREAVTFRRIDQGELVAHCTVARLPGTSPDQLPSLEQFQKDVQFSLREKFGHFVKARQWTTSTGNRCYGVVARGTVEEVPVEWRYYLVAKESGDRATLAFTIEERMAERLADADLKLVEALELVAPEFVETTPTARRDDEPEPSTAEVTRPTDGGPRRSRIPHRVGRRRGGFRTR